MYDWPSAGDIIAAVIILALILAAAGIYYSKYTHPKKQSHARRNGNNNRLQNSCYTKQTRIIGKVVNDRIHAILINHNSPA